MTTLVADYIAHVGDRTALYEAVAGATGARRVIYPGSYLDIAPSAVFPDVTYLDMDARARRAFADVDPLAQLAQRLGGTAAARSIAFVAGDYMRTLRDLPEAAWDLAISLYAGPVSHHVARCLRPGGWLLVNNSHADAGLAFLDARYELAAAIHRRTGGYRLVTDDLGRYFQPKRPPHPDCDALLASGRGIAYTHPADVYLFRRVPEPAD